MQTTNSLAEAAQCFGVTVPQLLEALSGETMDARAAVLARGLHLLGFRIDDQRLKVIRAALQKRTPKSD